MSETKFGFTDDLGVQDNYLPGGQIHSGLKLIKTTYSTAEGNSPEKLTLSFKNDNGIAEVDILAPNLSKTKATAKKTKEQMYDFFKRKTNNLFIGIAKAYRLDTKKLPPADTFKQTALTLSEALEPHIKANQMAFHIKFTKNKEGYTRIADEGLFMEIDNGQPTTLFFSEHEKNMNLIQKSSNSTERESSLGNVFETPESLEQASDLNFNSGEEIPDPFDQQTIENEEEQPFDKF